MAGIDFLLTKLGEFLPDDLADRGGAEEEPPLLEEEEEEEDPLPVLFELNEGETDLDEGVPPADLLLVKEAEIAEGMFKGFNLTVGVFLKWLLCKSDVFVPEDEDEDVVDAEVL